MALNKTHLIALIVGLVAGLLVGFLSGKAIYDKPINAKVERDTLTLWDTIPHWYPVPVETKQQKPQYKWLTRVVNTTDTLTLHDSVLVEVPIESRHYNAPEYDAWVSGYEPSLDSIKVYQKTEYITETVTLSKPPNKLSLDVQAGVDYFNEMNKLYPYLMGNGQYNINDRWSVGVRGGVYKKDNAQTFYGGYVKFRVF